MKKLRDHRAESSAGHDDRTLGAEWTARTDGNCRRNRLKNRNFRFNPAAVDQDGLNRFRDAVAPDALRAVASHDADDQRAANGDQYAERTKVITGGRDQ